MKICSKYIGYEEIQRGIYRLQTDVADMKICFLTDEILRIRTSFDRTMEEESYILSTTAWEDRLDAFLGEERQRIEPVQVAIEETEEALLIKSNALTLYVQKNPLQCTVFDKEDSILYRDIEGSPFILDSNHRVNHYMQMSEEDCFYGFGEKGGDLNKNKSFIRERATDAMGYDATKMDTLYKHIPFYIRMNRETQKATGFFYNNFYESVFNLGCEKSNYWPRYTYWQADGGDVDLFIIGGNAMSRVIDNYTLLTGRPALLPKRALGYQGSSMYYPELEKDSDDAVLGFIDTVKEEGFPIDGFHLSSGYTSYNNKRCVFTWNTTRFKDPRAYFEAMNEKGAQNVPNVKPGILLEHPWFDTFVEQDVFVKNASDNNYSVGKWWGGNGAFWDYTKKEAREIWKDYLKEHIIKVGTDSIWNDNCEYDSLLDKDSRCDFDGKGGTIGELKPLMSTIMCKVAHDAVKENNENARPYVVCRSGSAGIQKYAQTWCGDNFTSWKSLQYNIPIILGMGLSGQPNEGADIGGFHGNAPEEELFVRWVQNGIFQPRFSIHSASSDNTVTEPWMYQDSAPLIREAILFRYRMLPYLYSAEYEASQTGAPIMRPLVYEFQEDENVYDESFEFLFGRDILVANVIEPNATHKRVYLPKGATWYDWNNHFEAYEGGKWIDIPVTIETIPMFIREGAIIPIANNQIMSMERDPMTSMHLILAPGIDSNYELYDDDGKSNDFLKGIYRKTTITMTGKEVVTVQFQGEGAYNDFTEDIMIEMIHKEKSPFWVTLDDSELKHYLNRKKFEQASEGWYYSQTNKAVEIKYNNTKKDTKVVVSFEAFDLIGM